ncbi:MAG TPA: hypothetical protein VK544_04210 [Gemmatimonadaceae bacterium]|nr:hypothetical protein [Gemmatimonadaceae bacterium]
MDKAAQSYSHTQFGTVVLLSLAAAAIIMVASFALTTGSSGGIGAMPVPALAIVGLVLVILLVLAVVFAQLNVRVGNGEVSWRFGLGLLEHRIAISDIVSAAVVTNPILAGYGVRWLPDGWLYNVSGTKAVELVMRNGRRVRIGSDEPEALAQAIAAAR